MSRNDHRSDQQQQQTLQSQPTQSNPAPPTSLSLNTDLIKPSQTHQQSPIKAEEKGQIPTNPVEPSTHHLDPDEMASDPDEIAVVYSTLTTVENLVEVKPAVEVIFWF